MFLGAILVAQSERGVCAILLGDDPQQLVCDLQDKFRRATLIGADQAFEQLIAKVVGFIEAPALGLDLPLDVRGTAFQERVWQALRDIPVGSTASYADIAQRIGNPKAVRAVAQACGANSLAVAIPCHRVVRSDGNLSGYRWGVERKRQLLEREKPCRASRLRAVPTLVVNDNAGHLTPAALRFFASRLAPTVDQRFTSTTTRPRSCPASSRGAASIASLKAISWLINGNKLKSGSLANRLQASTRLALGWVTLLIPASVTPRRIKGATEAGKSMPWASPQAATVPSERVLAQALARV